MHGSRLRVPGAVGGKRYKPAEIKKGRLREVPLISRPQEGAGSGAKRIGGVSLQATGARASRALLARPPFRPALGAVLGTREDPVWVKLPSSGSVTEKKAANRAASRAVITSRRRIDSSGRPPESRFAPPSQTGGAVSAEARQKSGICPLYKVLIGHGSPCRREPEPRSSGGRPQASRTKVAATISYETFCLLSFAFTVPVRSVFHSLSIRSANNIK